MYILSEESFSRIEPLISDDYKRTRSRLALMLQPDDCEIFSIVDLLPNKGKWSADVSSPLHRYADASAIEREQIAAYLEDKRRAVVAQLSEKLPYAKDLFKVPDENSIFWYKDGQGNVRVVLSQWGFRRTNQPADVDVIEFLIVQPRPLSIQQVTFKATYSDGNPVAKVEFGLLIFNNPTSFVSDDNGEHFMGQVPVGQRFEVTDPEGQRYGFDVTAGRELYDVTIDRFTTYSIQVVGQSGEPVNNYDLTVNGQVYRTDDEGRIYDQRVKLTGNDRLLVNGQYGTEQEFPLQADPKMNDFVYRVTIPKKVEKKDEEEILPPPPPPAKKDVRVRILDLDGTPLDNVEVFIDQPGGSTISAISDADGYATFPRDTFIDKKKSKIRFTLTKEYRQRREAMKQQNANNQKPDGK